MTRKTDTFIKPRKWTHIKKWRSLSKNYLKECGDSGCTAVKATIYVFNEPCQKKSCWCVEEMKLFGVGDIEGKVFRVGNIDDAEIRFKREVDRCVIETSKNIKENKDDKKN